MISLFLNTSSNYLDIAVLKDNVLLEQLYVKLDKDLSRMALISIKELLDRNNIKPNDVDEVVCASGPGSFTGLRVGATIAKTFTYFLGKNLYSVSNLYVMATSCKSDYIVPIIDARRGYVFGAIYDSNYNVVYEESYIKLDDLIKLVNDLDGDKIFVSCDMFNDLDVLIYKPDICNLYNNMKKVLEDPITFVPNYLKRPEAEERLDDKRS